MSAVGLEFLTCATPGCKCKLAQVTKGTWTGQPLWIKCRRCGQFNRVDSGPPQPSFNGSRVGAETTAATVRVVPRPGDD